MFLFSEKDFRGGRRVAPPQPVPKHVE